MANFYTQRQLLYWLYATPKVVDDDNLALIAKEFRETMLMRASNTYYNRSALKEVVYGSTYRNDKKIFG